MAPFLFFLGPKSFIAGNLALRPAIMDGVELSYNLKQWWLTFKYSYTKDEIARFQPEVNPETGVQIYRSQNLEYLKNYEISTILPFKITSWWKMQNDVSFFFQTVRTLHYEPNVKQNLKNLKINTVNSFTLPWNLTAELSSRYQSAILMGITRIKARGALNIGIKKEFKNSSTLSIAANDLFKTDILKFESISRELNIHSYDRLDFGFRSVILTYSHSFGNKIVKDVNIRSHTEDETKRVQMR